MELSLGSKILDLLRSADRATANEEDGKLLRRRETEEQRNEHVLVRYVDVRTALGW